MKTKNKKVKSEIKMAGLCFIVAFISIYIWQILLHTGVAVYQSKKLGSREAGTAVMNELFKNNLALQIVSYVFMEIIVFIVAYLFIKKHNDGKFKLDYIGMKYEKNSIQHIGLGFGIALLMNIGMYFTLNIMGLIKFNGSESFNGPIYKIIGTVLLMFVVTAFPGFFEEILFRGVIQNYLMKRKGKVFALIISSICFSIMHVGMYPSLDSLAIVFIVGIVFGYLYIVTKSLYLPIGVHFAWDFYSQIIGFDNGIFNIKKAIVFDIIKNNENIMNLVIIIVYLLLFSSVIIKSRISANKKNVSVEQM